jgi:hypothetical protein
MLSKVHGNIALWCSLCDKNSNRYFVNDIEYINFGSGGSSTTYEVDEVEEAPKKVKKKRKPAKPLTPEQLAQRRERRAELAKIREEEAIQWAKEKAEFDRREKIVFTTKIGVGIVGFVGVECRLELQRICGF